MNYANMKKEELIKIVYEQAHLKDAVEAKDKEIAELRARQNDKTEVIEVRRTLQTEIKELQERLNKKLVGDNAALLEIQSQHAAEIRKLNDAHDVEKHNMQVMHNAECKQIDANYKTTNESLAKELAELKEEQAKNMEAVRAYVEDAVQKRDDLINTYAEMYASIIKTVQGATDAHALLFTKLNREVGILNGSIKS